MIFLARWDWARGMEEISRALELNPGFVRAIHLRARMLSLIGCHQEAIQAQKATNELALPSSGLGSWSPCSMRPADTALRKKKDLRMQAEPDPGLYFLMANHCRGKGMDNEWADAWE